MTRVDAGPRIEHACAMSSRSPFLAAVTAVALATPGFAQSPPATGLDAWKAVVGNTIVGKTPTGEALVEYFAPDGVVKNRIDGESDEGEWTLRGDKVCTDYSDDDDDGDEDGGEGEDSGGDEEAECYALSARGDALTLTDEAGRAREFRILPGNPQKL